MTAIFGPYVRIDWYGPLPLFDKSQNRCRTTARHMVDVRVVLLFVVLIFDSPANGFLRQSNLVQDKERAAQLNLGREYRTLTRAGAAKKPHKVWLALEPRPRAKATDARFAEERKALANHRDEAGWARLVL